MNLQGLMPGIDGLDSDYVFCLTSRPENLFKWVEVIQAVEGAS